jgi:hypothetical protein
MRTLKPEWFSGSAMSNAGNISPAFKFDIARAVHGVYSWRTGKRANSDVAESPPVPGTFDGYGISAPTTKGSLATRLADRKRYMEEFQRAAFPAETQSGSVSTDRTSTTDSGHLFATFKAYRSPMRAIATFGQPGASTSYSGDLWGAAGFPGFINPSPHSFSFAGSGAATGLGVVETQRQARANAFFASTAPDRNDATLAVTVIELLRGDIPSLLKNFQEMMAGMRSIKNLLGSDYLNITFGWTPLIQEYANVIRVGMQLERAVYYESFRRKRQWDGPTKKTALTESYILSNTGFPYPSGANFPSPGWTPPAGGSGLGISTRGETKVVESEDYHFTSKYTGLAKAGRRAESFSDQAVDVMRQLGVIDDPRLLWDLTPYSWLVDWFTSMGDSIANAAVYSPVKGRYSVDYAYMTTQYNRTQESLALLVPQIPANGDLKSLRFVKPQAEAYQTVRWRSRATPFGFGTQLGSLSTSQYAILVALGLARMR